MQEARRGAVPAAASDETLDRAVLLMGMLAERLKRSGQAGSEV